MNFVNTSPFCSRSRFLVKVVGSEPRIVRRQSHEPAIQKIVIQLLHQLAFRADAVEHLQQQGAQQLLRRDRRTSLAGVEPPKAAVQITQNIPDKFPDLPQWMVRWHTLIRRDVRKQTALIRKPAAHDRLRQFEMIK